MSMDWTQLLTIILTFVGLFIWNRTESRADMRHIDQKLDESRQEFLANQKETQTKYEANQRDFQVKYEANLQESRMILAAIQQEIKDFHGRLCAIEERRLKS